MRPLVSVVIASYNHANFVSRAVESVLAQPVPLEVIVIDDASTDGTADVVAQIKDPRLKLIRLKENRREHPRNLGLSMARSQYIAFQNSDDEWAPGKLAAQLDAFKKNRQAVASFTGVELIDKNGQPAPKNYLTNIFDLKTRPRRQWLRRFFDHGNCLCLTSALVRRDAIKKVGGFMPSLYVLSDFDLWIRLAAIGEFVTLEKPLTRMRILPGRNLSEPTPTSLRRSVIEFADVLTQYTEQPILEELPDIFSDVTEHGVTTPAMLRAALVQHAWTLGAGHRLFADRVATALLDQPETREEVLAIFGVEFVKEFIKQRGMLEIKVSP